MHCTMYLLVLMTLQFYAEVIYNMPVAHTFKLLI